MVKQRRRDRGSPKGKITTWERWFVFAKQRAWWIGCAVFYGIGDAAQYVKDNWLSVQGSMPWYAAAAVLGAIGVVLMLRDSNKVKNTDTRTAEQKAQEVQK